MSVKPKASKDKKHKKSFEKKRSPKTRVVMVGCGGMARHHIRQMLAQHKTTEITLLCEPSPEAYLATQTLFEQEGLAVPDNISDLNHLLATRRAELDAAFIITPHSHHFEQAKACLQAGLDVLLEKPMVLNQHEAKELIRVRDETGRLLVVAFNGSLSPNLRKAASMLRAGELGNILNISATVWQNWRDLTNDTWRQEPEIAGGGFLFDTGAHMLNSVADLAGEDFSEVAAWLDNKGRKVDILGAVMGRLASGALVTMNACGDAIPPTCTSEIQ
ncbi:MAG: Gfo/Idh/MocA family oxidoreductase [Deinococcales bacterium]